ncbi:MAG: proteasome subunit beta [Candidatus Aenigmarchaeota archaeon]|nr:proteasome subunit beta [Candidatus Aenigmarchaeota archaeon]
METLKTGTTTLGLVCKDAALMAADQRSSMGYLVASETMQKVLKLSDNVVMTIAGTAGDGQALARLMSSELKLYKLQEGEVTIKTAATLLANVLRSSFKSFRPDMVQILIGGYDVDGPHIYSVDLAGALEDAKTFAFTGSGSPMALGVLEDSYKDGMSVDEGLVLIHNALMVAKKRDLATGGKSVDVAVVTKDGVKWIPEEDILKLKK